ncbi:MAG: hypothetical protein QM652_05005 [Legionella sp.]|uniref:hypothetical protein n=1 Tax=Legionella sp. TaxID=459 RepID=UPI0039E34757
MPKKEEVAEKRKEYIDHIKALPQDGLLEFLNTIDEEENRTVMIHEEKLTPDDIIYIKKQAAEQYLSVALQESNADVLPVFKANTLDEFREALNNLFPAHPQINELISSEQIAPLKRIAVTHLVHTHINTLPIHTTVSIDGKKENLYLYIRAEAIDLNKLKDSLKAVTPDNDDLHLIIDQIKQEDITAIQEAARLRVFNYLLEQYTPFGVNRHPVLTQVFNSLNAKQENALLDASMNNSVLHTLINTADINVFKHFLNDVNSDDLIKKLATENRENQRLGSIQNPGIAEILLSFEPRIKISQENVGVLNEELQRLSRQSPDDISDEDYNNLITHIVEQFSTLEEGDKRRLDNIFRDLQNAQVIKFEHHANASLFERLRDGDVNREFVKLLLTVSKPGSQDANYFAGMEKNVAEVMEKFNKSGDQDHEDFFKSPKTDFLKQVLTPTMFRNLKSSTRKEAFNHYEMVGTELDKANAVFKQLDSNISHLGEKAEKLAFVSDITHTHIYNPLFQRELDKKWLEYNAVAKDCDSFIDELRHNQRLFHSYLESIPTPEQYKASLPNPKPLALSDKEVNDVSERLEKIREQIEKFLLAENDRLLKKYQEIREAITKKEEGILARIEASKSKEFVFNPASVKVAIMTREEANKEEITETLWDKSELPKNESLLITASKAASEVVKQHSQVDADFKLKDKAMQSNEVRCFEVVHKTTTKQELKGRFTYEKQAPEAADVVTSAKGVSKSSPGYYELVKFPQVIVDDQKRPLVTNEEVKAACMETAMVLAIQVLSGMEGAPPDADNPIRLWRGSEEELAFAWTAFAILRDKIPGMNYRLDNIEVMDKGRYDPSVQMGRFFGRFKNDSLYKEFEKSAEIQKYIKSFNKHAEQNLSANPIKQIDSKSINASKSYKKELEIIQKRVNREGPTPQNPDEENGEEDQITITM